MFGGIIVLRKRLKYLINKINWLYVCIFTIIFFGAAMLIFSSFTSSVLQNVLIGLGTGFITSSIVTLFIEIINKRFNKTKIAKYKRIILNPIAEITKKLYIDSTIRINEFLIENNSNDWIINYNIDSTKLKDFFTSLKKRNFIEQDKNTKKALYEMLSLPTLLYDQLLKLYSDIPLDSLLFDNVISEEENNALKRSYIFLACKDKLSEVKGTKIDNQKTYVLFVDLLYTITSLLIKVINTFNFIQNQVGYENENIINHLEDKYFYEVYSQTEEYVLQEVERAESEMEDYEQPYEEETDKKKLYRNINTAIWSRDKKEIIKLFPQIDKDDSEIKKLFIWRISARLMKDKLLRQMYLDKFGVKYKPEKVAWQKLIKKLRKIIRKFSFKRKQ